MAMAMIRASDIDLVVATADSGNAIAVRWLKRLGFRPADEQTIEGKVLFIWTRKCEGTAERFGVLSRR